MEEIEMTQEQSDELILQEMGLAEDDSTTNDEEETDEETTDVEADVEETEEESDDEEEEVEEEKPKKPKKGIQKLLAQRREAREEVEQAKTEVQQLQEELDRLKSAGKGKSEEYLETFTEKLLAQQNEVTEYFDSNEQIRPYKKDIQNYAKETGLSLERATNLYLAENNPNLLLDSQTQNQKKAKTYDVPSHSPKNLGSKKVDYSDAEFDKMAKSGKIQF